MFEAKYLFIEESKMEMKLKNFFCCDEEFIKKKLERESKHDFESDFFMLKKTTE
jgi:hypothetical protein